MGRSDSGGEEGERGRKSVREPTRVVTLSDVKNLEYVTNYFCTFCGDCPFVKINTHEIYPHVWYTTCA